MLRNHKAIRTLKTLCLAICILFCSLAAPVRKAQQSRIAAASDLQFAMNDLVLRYGRKAQAKLSVAYSSSVNVFTQIEHSAPLDLFFSADLSSRRAPIEQKLSDPQTLNSCAFGRITLRAFSGAQRITEARGFSALLDLRIQKIAIARPEHAPYGQATLAVLEKAGSSDQVESKSVYGRNRSQTSQFVLSGNAQFGLAALSVANGPHKKTAIAFREFVKTAEARGVHASYSFTIRQPQAREQKL